MAEGGVLGSGRSPVCVSGFDIITLHMTPYPRLPRNHRHWLPVIVLLAMVAGCSNGPALVRNTTTDYNRAVRQVQNEELLLNIVRARYAEPPQFVRVSGINTSFSTSVSSRSATGWTNGFGGNTGATIDGSIAFADNPTISLSPRQGEELAKEVLEGVSTRGIAYLANADYRIDHVLVMLAEQINGIRSFDVGNAMAVRGGDPAFGEVIENLSTLLEQDQVLCGFLRHYDQFEHTVATADLRPSDYLAALQSGKRWNTLEDDETRSALFTYEMEPVIWISKEGQASDAGKQFMSTLRLDPEVQVYWLVDANVRTRPTGLVDSLFIRTRSFYGVMNLLSQAVSVPLVHEKENMATPTMLPHEALAEMFQRLLPDILNIQASTSRPDRAWVSVKHKEFWFYIDERDIPSKRAFALTAELFNLQVGGGPEESDGPILTLPVN